ncbi:MAG: NrfD/PsrC family molybdoenzyme membrane anchor subunit [Dehalococcoidales bacterium]|nr:NrfD/PsrC family molybdoenzyme membrane anchor subunit [Dehalococcoidales bacterium]
MEGFIYPNEAIIEWDLLIVIYPYITGLVAGAFIVSSLYHVFGIKQLKPVARFSLVTALAFLLVAPLPLVFHLGRPERALEMFLRPNLVSAMSAFGYIWFFYLLLVLAEVWLVFRPDIVNYAKSTHGLKQTIYSALALGSYDVSPQALAADHRLIKVLALVGIPAASLLHGYVGFIFGAVKANPWWSTPLMPIIFLLSAVVSGIALLLVLYIVSSKLRHVPLDHECLRSMTLWLSGFLVLALTLECLEVFSMLYESEESWDIISQLITQKLAVTYLIIQFGIGSVLSLAILAATELVKFKEQVKTVLRFAAAIFILVGVFAMRWDVVIGGQLVSKSLRGLSDFTPELMGQGGLLVSGAILLLPFIILSVIVHFIPPWEKEPGQAVPAKLAFQRASFK